MPRFLRKLALTDVLVVDDFCMTPLNEVERRDFLEICDDRYQTCSTVLTSQVPVPDWHVQIGDPTAAIAGLVSYQDGSVISRTLLKRTTGTVTLFAFDEGEGLSEHSAAFDALVHILEGEADITISGKLLRTHTTEAVLLPANQSHAVKAITSFKMLLTMIRS